MINILFVINNNNNNNNIIIIIIIIIIIMLKPYYYYYYYYYVKATMIFNPFIVKFKTFNCLLFFFLDVFFVDQTRTSFMAISPHQLVIILYFAAS